MTPTFILAASLSIGEPADQESMSMQDSAIEMYTQGDISREDLQDSLDAYDSPTTDGKTASLRTSQAWSDNSQWLPMQTTGRFHNQKWSGEFGYRERRNRMENLTGWMQHTSQRLSFGAGTSAPRVSRSLSMRKGRIHTSLWLRHDAQSIQWDGFLATDSSSQAIASGKVRFPRFGIGLQAFVPSHTEAVICPELAIPRLSYSHCTNTSEQIGDLQSSFHAGGIHHQFRFIQLHGTFLDTFFQVPRSPAREWMFLQHSAKATLSSWSLNTHVEFLQPDSGSLRQRETGRLIYRKRQNRYQWEYSHVSRESYESYRCRLQYAITVSPHTTWSAGLERRWRSTKGRTIYVEWQHSDGIGRINVQAGREFSVAFGHKSGHFQTQNRLKVTRSGVKSVFIGTTVLF